MPDALARWAALVEAIGSGTVLGEEWAKLIGCRLSLQSATAASEFYDFRELTGWLEATINPIDVKFMQKSRRDPHELPAIPGASSPDMWWAQRVPHDPVIRKSLPMTLSPPDRAPAVVFPPLPERTSPPQSFLETDVSGQDMRGSTLSGLNLAGIDFRDCDLSGAGLLRI